MASTNASMISLSAFPKPPETMPPVPALPILQPYNPPKPDMPSRQSYILHVDLPFPPSADVAGPGKSNADAAQQPAEPQSSDKDTNDRAENLNTENAPSQPTDPSAGLPTPTAVKAKSPITPISEHRDRPREPHFDFGEPPDFDGFDETKPPTQRQLEEAAGLQVISESGVRVPFGNLWREQKTIVCFIRHFWWVLFLLRQHLSESVVL
jgi:hypothetical protein